MPETKTVKEIYDILGKLVKEGRGKDLFKSSILFKDNIELYYKDVVDMSTHKSVVNIHATMPDYDDINIVEEQE